MQLFIVYLHSGGSLSEQSGCVCDGVERQRRAQGVPSADMPITASSAGTKLARAVHPSCTLPLWCAQLQEHHNGAGSGMAGGAGAAQPSLRGLHLSVTLLACASFW